MAAAVGRAAAQLRLLRPFLPVRAGPPLPKVAPAVRRLWLIGGLSLVALAVAAAPAPAVIGTLLAVAAVAVLAYPPLGLAAVALAVPFGAAVSVPLGSAAITPAPILLGWTALAWAWPYLVRGRLPPVLARPPAAWPGARPTSDGARRRRPPAGRAVVVALSLYVAILCLSALRAPDLVAGALEIARWLELGMALVIAAQVARSWHGRAIVLGAILLAGTGAAVLGVLPASAGGGPEAFAVLGAGFARAYGTFGQPNPFGAYMNMVWPVGIALVALPLLARGRRSAALALWPALGAIAALSCGIGLVYSWSRGAWLAAASALALMAVLWVGGTLRRPRSPGRLSATWLALVALLAAVALTGGFSLPGSLASRLGSIAQTFAVWDVADAEVTDLNYATIERVAHWQAAAAMWAERPWLGQGPGQYELEYARFRLPRWPQALGHAHNYYLQALAESGLIGLAAFLVLLATALGFACRSALRSSGPLAIALGLGVAGVLAAVSVHSLVDNVFVHDMAPQLGLLLGLLAAAGDA